MQAVAVENTFIFLKVHKLANRLLLENPTKKLKIIGARRLQAYK